MAKTIVVIGALDTKGPEFAFVKEAIEDRGHQALVINTGVTGEPSFAADVPAAATTPLETPSKMILMRDSVAAIYADQSRTTAAATSFHCAAISGSAARAVGKNQ